MDSLQQQLDGIPVHAGQRLRIAAVPGGVRAEGVLGPESARGRGYDQAHGGMVAALLDTAATFALVAHTGKPWTTVDFRVDYLRPVPLGPVVLTGSVVRAGRTVGRASAELLDGAGLRCATAIGTFVP
ncbi:MAG TPA: PaaI family thioesterase [Streptosporangiaceae bacterium]